jgi:hypothetical protein
MDESFVDVVSIVAGLSFVFLVQKIVISLNVGLGTNHAWSLCVATLF